MINVFVKTLFIIYCGFQNRGGRKKTNVSFGVKLSLSLGLFFFNPKVLLQDPIQCRLLLPLHPHPHPHPPSCRFL